MHLLSVYVCFESVSKGHLWSMLHHPPGIPGHYPCFCCSCTGELQDFVVGELNDVELATCDDDDAKYGKLGILNESLPRYLSVILQASCRSMLLVS
jgi:hypothetical protein